jgi:hypothetical protein
VGNGSGLSRGDRNRNARLARLRELVPLSHAIAGIGLADDTQAAVVTDHDSRVIARRRVSARAWELGELPGLGGGQGSRCRVRVGHGGVRAGRAPVAGAGSARGGAGAGAGVRAAAAGPAGRGRVRT